MVKLICTIIDGGETTFGKIEGISHKSTEKERAHAKTIVEIFKKHLEDSAQAENRDHTNILSE